MTSKDVVARARQLVGVRFRPQGRGIEHGLDCLGVAAFALDVPAALLPADYRLRSRVADPLLDIDLGSHAKRTEPTETAAGDVLLVQSGAGQEHFLVLTGDGFVHAHLGLGRVVETPGAVPWPVRAAWRVQEN